MLRIIAQCVAAKLAANRRPNYVHELQRFLTRFAEDHPGQVLGELTPGQIDEWLSRTHPHPATRATAMNRLSALFTFACRRGFAAANPIERLDRVRVERRPPRILTPEEASDLVAASRRVAPEMLGWVTLGLYAGLRPAELDRLTWLDVDVGHARVCVAAAASKVRRRRVVPLHAKAVTLLRTVASTGPGPITPRQKRRRRRRIETELGWDHWPHDLLRHTAASYLLALHQDPPRVAFWLGNSVGVLLTHYHELVTPEECERFWALPALSP